ncbi:MAG: tRNA (adenosine(37)-N6)-dimethylallyltransferase MiaA [bacterium]
MSETLLKSVPFLVGPTASGKTEIALIIAEKLGSEIISADSRQLYQGMEIGSAQPNAAELGRIPHHFIACLEVQTTFSAGEYSRLARAKIVDLLDRQIVPLVVGGSGLYIATLADDFFAGPSADPEIRSRFRQIAAAEGIQRLYQELTKVDPDSAQKIMPTDYRRIERALEIYHLTGIPISEMRKTKANPPPYHPIMVGLKWQRETLYARINARCLKMLEMGLLEEVSRLWDQVRVSGDDALIQCNALNSVGYAEVIRYFQGGYDYAEMVRLFQRNSRRFAKRQISWFARDQRITWIPMDEFDDAQAVAAYVCELYSKAGIKAEIENRPVGD